MNNIVSALHLVADMNGSTLWRVLQPVTALQAAGYPCGWAFNGQDGMAELAERFDIIVLPRMSWRPEHRGVAENWFETLRRAGKTVIYESDDDIFTPAETRRRIELDWLEGKTPEEADQERVERVWAMRQCDGVIVSTQFLGTIMRTLTDAPVKVVPNSIDLPWFQRITRATQRQVPGLTIGWAGGKRHDRDVMAMAEAWGRLADRHPEVTFVVAGWAPEVVREHVPEDRLVELEWLPLEQYPALYAQLDIGCASVADIPFNRPKSSIKAMEYAAAGACVVASPLLYSGLIDHGFSGLIAESAAEWEDCLTMLIESPSLRRMMQRRLMKVIEKKHTLAKNLHRWPLAWQEIVQEARSRHGDLARA